jgi:hypothetical protein
LDVLIVSLINHGNLVRVIWSYYERAGWLLRSRICETSHYNNCFSVGCISWNRLKLKLSILSLVDTRSPYCWLCWITAALYYYCVRIYRYLNRYGDCVKSTSRHKTLAEECKLVCSLCSSINWRSYYNFDSVTTDGSWDCGKTSLIHSIINLEMLLCGVLEIKSGYFYLTGIFWRELICNIVYSHLKHETWLSRSFVHNNLKNFYHVSCQNRSLIRWTSVLKSDYFYNRPYWR